MPASIEAIIDRQLRRWEMDRRSGQRKTAEPEAPVSVQPVITVSRQHGSLGAEVARRLAERFRYTLLHRNIIDRIGESTGYTRRLLEALDEHSRSQLTSWIDSMLSGRYLDERGYATGLVKTVYSIARLGGVVVVGRGANFIVGPEGGMHIRIVGPHEERLRALMERKRLPAAEAAREIAAVDRERARFVRKLFGRSVDDPLAYDLIANQSGRTIEALVRIVGAAAEEKVARLRAAPPVMGGTGFRREASR